MPAHVPPGRGRGLPGLIIDLLYVAKLDRDEREKLKRKREGEAKAEELETATHYLAKYDADVLDEADFVFEERHGPYREYERRQSTGRAETEFRKICNMLQREKREHGRILTRGMADSPYRDRLVAGSAKGTSSVAPVLKRLGCGGCAAVAALAAGIALAIGGAVWSDMLWSQLCFAWIVVACLIVLNWIRGNLKRGKTWDGMA